MRHILKGELGGPVGEERPRWRRGLRLVGLVLILLAIFSALGDRGVARLYRLVHARTDLAREIARLREVNERLAEEARALREDPSRVERIARDELGLVRPGDIVYDFRGAREGSGERR